MKNNYNDKNHFQGRIFLLIAILLICLVPVIMMIALKTLPDFAVIGACFTYMIVFIIGGFVEVMTYSPMLGTNGTYLAFFTGNLANLKIPCVVNARELAGVKHGSVEGEIVSTVSVATSTIVTTLVITLGVILIIPLQPILQNETLQPAFDTAFTALFGALAYKYFTKDPLLVPVPFALLLLLEGLIGLGTSILIPVGAVASILFALALFKKANKKEQ